jgi:hypothetical protein
MQRSKEGRAARDAEYFNEKRPVNLRVCGMRVSGTLRLTELFPRPADAHKYQPPLRLFPVVRASEVIVGPDRRGLTLILASSRTRLSAETRTAGSLGSTSWNRRWRTRSWTPSERLSSWQTRHVGQFWGELRKEYPNTEDQPPIFDIASGPRFEVKERRKGPIGN